MRPDDVLLAELLERSAADAVELDRLIEANRGQLDELLSSLEPQRQELEKRIEVNRAETEAFFAQMGLTIDH